MLLFCLKIIVFIRPLLSLMIKPSVLKQSSALADSSLMHPFAGTGKVFVFSKLEIIPCVILPLKGVLKRIPLKGVLKRVPLKGVLKRVPFTWV